jgi:hypothetical protein
MTDGDYEQVRPCVRYRGDVRVPTARAEVLQVMRRLPKHGLGVRRLNAACAAELDAYTLAWEDTTTENRDPMNFGVFRGLVP